jgi:hypothetical protein
MATITVKNPAYPEGFELEVPGAGLFKNFETRELDEFQLANFRAFRDIGDEENLVLDDFGKESEPPPEDDIDKMKVDELRKALEDLQLDTSGVKAELVDRLKEATS